MTPFQIIAIAAIAWLGINQFLRVKNAPAIKILYQLRWFFMTVLAALLVIDPHLSSFVAKKLEISRGVDVVIYFALLWLLYQNYSLSQEIEALYQKLDELVRKLALKDVNGKEPKKEISTTAKGNKERQ